MLLALAGTFFSCILSASAAADSSSNLRWINTWTAMPQLTEFSNLPNPPFNGTTGVFRNSTIRQTLHMSIGGDTIRIRFSNAFGPNNLNITAATVALPEGGVSGASAVVPGSIQQVTFSGNPGFSIPDAGQVVSDPISFPIKAQQTITVTIYLSEGQDGFDITSHPGSRATTWMQFGNAVHAQNITSPDTQSLAHWYFVSAVETLTTPSASAFFIVGDSITDGRGSDTDENDRWPDLLLRRMQQYGPTTEISVNNQAAGGNRILADGLGPAALGRIDRDVLAQTGKVKYSMIFEGVNDIGVADPTEEAQQQIGDALIAAFKQISTRVHAQGIPFFAATITPFGAPANDSSIQPYSNPIREQQRQRINTFIRTSPIFDAIIDFDKVVADPQIPSQLAPQFDSGDFLHPNVAGYTAMAAIFPLDLFAKFADGVWA
ncbi:Extracellular GDSL-like lipase/acylhydrolase [Mycena chlorophos]|uniref:Extracellular GDSL-like lipase/acylhydrolase n=1 Tax=Mycena chlorophos TaxID=658473 RepID=A0A8H6WJB8_MYCCL|nr:Extracellular GDSL-like lipase/acylhydrolase [Mycena chlorophos]